MRLADERIEPAQVEVTMRERDIERLSDAQRVIVANVDALLGDAPRGEIITLQGVPLARNVGGYPAAAVQPSEVDVTLRVVAQQSQRRFDEPISVQVLAGPQFYERYEIERRDANDWLIELEVTGAKLQTCR